MAKDKSRSKERPKARGEQPSGYTGENPATAGRGKTNLRSDTPENRSGEINPSAPTAGTEGPSTNLGNPISAEGEGMGSMGYGGFNKPRHSEAEIEAATGRSPTEKRPGKEDPGNLRSDEKKKDIA